MSQRSAQGEVSMDKDGDSILNRSQQSGSKMNSVNQIDGILGDPDSAQNKSFAKSTKSKRSAKKPVESKKQQELDPANQFRQIDIQAVQGNWGDKKVFASNLKAKDGTQGDDRQQTGEIRERLVEIYGQQTHPPECFVAQMAFSSLNSFMLTTDGRVFSWGALSYCLGR